MKQFANSFSLSACALAASLLISACGGGDKVDTIAPTVSITSATTASTVTFYFAFSEAVASGSFTAEDVAISGGTAGALTMVTPLQYSLVVTPTAGAASVTATIATGKFADVANNPNTEVATNSYTVHSASADTVLANFDTVLATDIPDTNGGTGSFTTNLPAGGGSGSAYALLRSGGTVYALGLLQTAAIPFTAERKTISARVYSPTAGIPMVLKLENKASAGAITTGNKQANETVVAGWQTLTWTFNNADLTKAYDFLVVLPNLETMDPAPGKTYYFDDITLLPAAGGTAPTAPTNLVTNGTFSAGATGWSGNAANVLTEGGNSFNFADVGAAGNPYDVNLSYVLNIPTSGVAYKLRFKASSNRARTMVAGIGLNQDPWTNATQTVNLTTTPQTFELSLTSNFASPTSRVIFDLGAAVGTVSIDDVELVLDTTPATGPIAGAAPGSGGLQPLTIATGDVKTGDGGNTMFVSGEGLFAVNYVGSAETQAPFNLAAWPNAKTANFASITGIAGGDIGYFQDDVNLSNSSQKVDEGGWVSGTAIGPNGVPNFFRYFVLKGAVSASAYMGLYVNAPNNGFVDATNFGKIKFKVWGPGPMFERGNFTPILEMTLAGPKVAGCTTGSGGTEITQNVTANLRNGAGGAFTLPFTGFTVKGLCGTDTEANAVANVRAKLARVVVTVPGTSFNYTNLDGGNYATGLNLGPVGFTNN